MSAYYLDYGDGFTSICICSTHQIVYIKYEQLIKLVKKKKRLDEYWLSE